MNNNQAINDKLKNLINISPRDYCINSKSKSRHFFITDKFGYDELVAFINLQTSVLKFDESYNLSKLNSLQKIASNYFKESGDWPLFIARYFLTYTSSKGKKIYAPLFLQKIKIEKNLNNNAIYLIDDENVINEKILTFLEREFSIELSSLFKDEKFSINEYIDKLQISLNKNIKLIGENEEELCNKNEMVIVDSFIIGLYEPSGGKLKDDLLHIINEGIDPFLSEKIHGEAFYEQCEINDEPIFQISNNLNLYQKYAIRSSLCENTVIHGPPGTGKSEVIANIIANIILSEKSALVVSEKKAAIDVIVDRIQDLKLLTISLYDDMKSEFYDNLVNLFDEIGTDWLSQSFKSSSFSLLDHAKMFSEYKSLKQYKTNIFNFANKLLSISSINEKTNNKLFEFWSLLNSFGIDKYLNLLNKPIVDFILNLDANNENLNNLFDFIVFSKTYQLINDANVYYQYLEFGKKLKEDWKNSNLDIEKYLKKIANIIYQLDNILKTIDNDHQIFERLKNNPYFYYNIYIDHQNVLDKYQKLIDSKFFNVLNNHNFKDFLVQLNKTSTINKKTLISEYLNSGKILEKTPLFKKINKIDDYTLEFFTKLYDNGYYFLNPLIITKMENFKPIYIESLFNYRFIDQGMQKFLSFDIEEFPKFEEINLLINNNFNLEDIKKFAYIKNLQNELKINNLEINNQPFDLLLNTKSDFALKTIDIKKLYLNKIKNSIANLPNENKEKIKELIRISHLKKKPSIYKVINRYWEILKVLFPIWFTKPEHAALFLPLERKLFDYGIFDEASQMFLEKSFALVYRVQTSIVAGDDKQLKPSSFFMSIGNDDEIEYEINDTNVAESLLEKAQASLWNNFILKNHYRSQSKDLIEFSNKYFYEQKLIYASNNIASSNRNHFGIETINVDGYFNNGINEIEADKVIEILESNITKYNKIIIITFNVQQAKHIEKEIIKLNNPHILEKIEQNLLVVTNLENVQGNEGDLTIISVSYAKKDANSKLHANFGPLINDGGSNRLNVAITRAKDKMIVIKSFNAGDISITNNDNLLIFRNFIAFLDTKITDEGQINRKILDEQNNFYNFINSLSQKYNLEINVNYNVGSDNIDYVFLKNEVILFCINFRKINFYKNLLEFNTDLDKNIFLNSRNYKVHLINEWEWLLSQKCIKDYLLNIFDDYNK